MPSPLDERLRELIQRKAITPARKPRKQRKRKTKGSYDIDPTRLHLCSESELVAIAHHLGHETVSRAMSDDDIIEIILGESEAEPGLDLLASIRETIHSYVNKNRSLISPAQMRCDLDCPNCPHQRVVECYTVNQDLVE